MENTQGAVAEMLEMIPVARAHGLQEVEISKMNTYLNRIVDRGYNLDLINALFGAVNWVVFQSFQMICLAFTAYLAVKGKISVGEVVLYQTYFTSLVGQISTLINIYPQISQGLESVKSIGDIMGNSHVEENNSIVPLGELKGAVKFVIVDFMGGTVDEACALYVRIRQQLQQFVEDNHYEVVFTISGGILNCADVWEKSYSNIMKISEFALNEAKRNGKNRYNIFTSKDYENFLRKKQITKILRQSILNHFEGFEAYFQPLFHAEDNTLYGAETLMRFHCAELGMISPAEFIPILEETGLIIPAGRWIMRQALACGKKIQRVIPNFQISINVSYMQIMKSDISSEIAAAIEEFEVNPANGVIELTESGLLESDPRFTSLWGSLKSEGIRLALDDFGTGYSNFHYLYELKPDIIKIDRSFTAKALSNEYDYNLLSLMSDMVHHLDLKLCVEGIETEEERIRLQQVGPDYSQGFFFGRPCPYKQFHYDFVAKCSA